MFWLHSLLISLIEYFRNRFEVHAGKEVDLNCLTFWR